MRKTHYLIAVAGLLSSAAVVPAGCIDYRAEYYLPLTNPDLLDGGLDGDGGGMDAEAGVMPGCIPSQNVGAVPDTCGIFVSSSTGDDSAAGSKAQPLKTLSAALAKAKGMPVYACGESFSEQVSIAADATLYGALDCTNAWAYDAAKKTQLTAAADVVPLTISTATTKLEVYDFAITAANATQAGGSSIAVLVAQASADFVRCDLSAGNAQPGGAGATYQTSAQAGSTGSPGNTACSGSFVAPGLSVTNTCGGGGSAQSMSGAGGLGQPGSGGTGSPGTPGSTTNMNGGPGDTGSGCGPGTQGTNGDVAGAALPGLGATGPGTVTASGYTGVVGGAGAAGNPGQGGGGGGGEKGGTGAGMCTSSTSNGGASGGSGGSGGCGGAGGNGGNPGGSSIALIAISATLSFTSVTLTIGVGGMGGNGGAGQTGGMGGPGGPGGQGKSAGFTNLADACPGGPGGQGGAGGMGGGGLGGHSLGLAVSGTAPPKTGWTATPGTAGMGGMGDDSMGNKGDGANGNAAPCWDFVANMACPM